MNSLDAIIALFFLLFGLSLLLAGIGQYGKENKQIESVLDAKQMLLECGSTIDSFYSNSADTFEGTLKCFVEDGKIKVQKDNIWKTISVIPKIKKEVYLEVGTVDHYK